MANLVNKTVKTGLPIQLAQLVGVSRASLPSLLLTVAAAKAIIFILMSPIINGLADEGQGRDTKLGGTGLR